MFELNHNDGAVVLANETKRLRISFATNKIARITLTDGKPFKTGPSFMVENRPSYTDYQVEERPEVFNIATDELKLQVARETGAISYFDKHGNLLLREPKRGGKFLKQKDVCINIYDKNARVTGGQSIDGARASAKKFETVFDRKAFEAKLEFVFAADEAIFGLGSHEEGYGNMRGKSQDLYQQNMKAVVPYFISTKGYGILLDCYSLMTFHDDACGSYLWADVVDELDYYFISGGKFDEVTRGYHALTGKPPMLPKWAFGYTQSKERYVNAREIVEVVGEYRRRKIPLDLIVLDWKSWPTGAGWGQKSFDPIRFPDPQAFTRELHNMGAKLMISIWPIMTGDCPNQRELQERGLMLGNQSTYNAFLDGGRKVYWEQAKHGLFAHGVDAWWCDCTEPFEADWEGAVKPERHHRLIINTQQAKQYLDPGYISVYSLLHSKGVYEGQREVTSEKRVVNLTRSSYAGQHRYSTISWNGDICGTWESLRRCIPEGLNFCATGEPYWTVDIGGFFIKNDPALWFWRGGYEAGCRGLTDMNALEPNAADAGCTDLGFHELYTRWIQYGIFLPMFRSHGTDAAREIWRFGDEGNSFYDTIAKYIRLRYQLLPYIYSLAAQVTLASGSLMRHVALEFPQDTATHDLTDQFLFGSALMVCPVTTPMYFRANSEPITSGEKTREVYLPADSSWYEFWTGQGYEGGQKTTTVAPLETLPLFVRAGSIVPLGPNLQYSMEKPADPIELRVYPGANGSFTLYEDEGDNYNYEKGFHATIPISWDEKSQTLTLGQRMGEFTGMLMKRTFRIVWVKLGHGTGIIPAAKADIEILYTGEEVILRPPKTELGFELHVQGRSK